MKQIKLNPDGTLNILDDRKYYVAKLVWYYNHDDNEADFWECNFTKEMAAGYVRYPVYRFTKLGSLSGISVWFNKYLQNSCFDCIKTMNSAVDYYKGTLYQFDSKQEFIELRKGGWL